MHTTGISAVMKEDKGNVLNCELIAKDRIVIFRSNVFFNFIQDVISRQKHEAAAIEAMDNVTAISEEVENEWLCIQESLAEASNYLTWVNTRLEHTHVFITFKQWTVLMRKLSKWVDAPTL